MQGKIRFQAHALMIPLPQQGHTTPMLQLAQVLMDNHVFVTFLCSDSTFQRLGKPEPTREIRFLTFPEPPEQMTPFGTSAQYQEYIGALEAGATEAIDAVVGEQESCTVPCVSAVISDGLCTSLRHRARKHGLAAIDFITMSAAVLALVCHTSLLFQHRLLPPPKDEGALQEFMEKPLEVIQSMPWLRGKDLLMHQHQMGEPINLGEFPIDALDAVLINTWENLEGFALADLNNPDKYAGKAMGIGPMLAWNSGKTPVSSSQYREDWACLRWLDNHKSRTVVYLSFGSTGVLSVTEILIMTRGLLKSGYSFLWVVDQGKGRQGYAEAKVTPFPKEMQEMLQNEVKEERWCLVEWAPQKEVLEHPAIGAFVTHGGWNSILEGLLAGVPMLCWCSGLADQPHNRRFLSHRCRVSLQLEPGYTSDDVVKCVRVLMDPCDALGCELRRNVELIRDSAMAAVAHGGSSRASLARLLEIIVPRR